MNRAWRWIVGVCRSVWDLDQSSEELRREREYRRDGWPGDA
jgi:hypothetical protein